VYRRKDRDLTDLIQRIIEAVEYIYIYIYIYIHAINLIICILVLPTLKMVT